MIFSRMGNAGVTTHFPIDFALPKISLDFSSGHNEPILQRGRPNITLMPSTPALESRCSSFVRLAREHSA